VKLFKYEMKKLILHKNRQMFLAVMFALFVLMGLWTSSGTLELRKSNDYSEYINLVEENSGTLNTEQLKESIEIAEEAKIKQRQGDNDSFIRYLNQNPVVKFHYDYANYGERVYEYLNGPEYQDNSDIKGIYPLQDKLNKLEGSQGSYEYKYYQKRLETELSHGEPVFAYTQFWNNFATSFDISRVVFMLLMLLAYIIAPIFTQEIKADMNSIVLCSLKGRREIVTAKLLTVCSVAAILTILYFSGYFIGAFIATGNITGFNEPARSFATFEGAIFDTTVVGLAMLGILWTMLAAVVFGLVVCLISALAKNQTTVFGLSVVFMLTFSMLGFSPDYIHAMIWPLIDFNLVALSFFNIIFNSSTMYNFFGMPLSYGLTAFMVCIAFSVITVLLTYIVQKWRQVA
jgi:hypothetical protein